MNCAWDGGTHVPHGSGAAKAGDQDVALLDGGMEGMGLVQGGISDLEGGGRV